MAATRDRNRNGLQWKSPGARTGFSDGNSLSVQRRRSGAATVGMVPSGSFKFVNSRWAADVKGKPGSEPDALHP